MTPFQCLLILVVFNLTLFLAMDARNRRQKKIAKWAIKAFGVDEATSLPQRGLRLLEEALEVAQSVGLDKILAIGILEHVYSKEPGKPVQELGGVGIGVLALAAALDVSAESTEILETRRIHSFPIDHFTKRNKVKNDLGFKV